MIKRFKFWLLCKLAEDFILPCSVKLPPCTNISKGCTLKTLIIGIKARENQDYTFDFPL